MVRTRLPSGGRRPGRSPRTAELPVAGLCFDGPSRLIYRTWADAGAGKARASPRRTYVRFLDAAHRQLGGPIVLVWDNPNTYVSRVMRELIAACYWLAVFQFPGYAFELARSTRLVKTWLIRMQCGLALLDGFLAKTRFDLLSRLLMIVRPIE